MHKHKFAFSLSGYVLPHPDHSIREEIRLGEHPKHRAGYHAKILRYITVVQRFNLWSERLVCASHKPHALAWGY